MPKLIPPNPIIPGLDSFLPPYSDKRVTKLKNSNTDYTPDTELVVQYDLFKLEFHILHNKNILSCQSSDVNRQCTDNQKQKSEENRQKSQCRFCNSSNLSTKPALAKGYEKIICSDCGRFQRLVKAIASNKNQEVVL